MKNGEVSGDSGLVGFALLAGPVLVYTHIYFATEIGPKNRQWFVSSHL